MGLTAPGRKLLGAGPAHSVPGCARRVLGRPPQADSRPGPRSAEGHFSACGPWWAGQLELGRPWPWMRLPARGQQGSGCQVLGARAQCLGSRLEKPSFPGSPRCRQRPRPAPRGHGGRGDSTVAAGRPQWSGRHVYVTFPAAPCPLAGGAAVPAEGPDGARSRSPSSLAGVFSSPPCGGRDDCSRDLCGLGPSVPHREQLFLSQRWSGSPAWPGRRVPNSAEPERPLSPRAPHPTAVAARTPARRHLGVSGESLHSHSRSGRTVRPHGPRGPHGPHGPVVVPGLRADETGCG